MMSDELTAQAFAELRRLAKKTSKQLKQLKADTDRSNPVDVDVIKTTKAMFYEQAVEIFRKYKEES